MTGRIQTVLLHLTGCIIFLTLPILFSPESLSLYDYLNNPPTQRDIIVYILLLGVFYLNYYLLIPKLYFPRKYLLFVLANLICFTLITWLPETFWPRRHGPPPPAFYPLPSPHPVGPLAPPRPGRPSEFHRFLDPNEHIFLFFLVLALALLLKIRDRLKRAEEEKLNAELAYLKAQVNPHFLFNTLNSIYAMALSKSDQTAGAVVKLSSIMRYVLVDAHREKVSLQNELTHLINYIELQQTRFEGTLQLDFKVNGRPEGRQIVPLLLIPFIENAFKHGVNPEKPSIIAIRIDIGDHDLHLKVSNNKVAFHLPDDDRSGLGIQNTRQRLQMHYPGQHTLTIEDGPESFTVFLTLNRI
jgi:two-component sensor histidine kinase